MDIIRKVHRLCSCCMQEHDVWVVRDVAKNIYKEQLVEYSATYEYCELADEYLVPEELITANDIAMKNAYREANGLLTTEQIVAIRKKYNISQSDLANLLGWGGKTITRYEGHQVQDVAHDTILRKIDSDPEWYLTILQERKKSFAEVTYAKYYRLAVKAYEETQDAYLRKSIFARYARYDDADCNGGRCLDIEKLIDVMRYYSNSNKVSVLYKVKMMKMLWYADALAYKRYNSSITGLVYTALPMGAVPVAHGLIMDLKGISYEEIEYEDNTAYHFKSDNSNQYPTLTDTDRVVLDTIIDVCGGDTRDQIVKRMHGERAYKETKANEVILFKYAKELSID
ncbi:MAG: DUF4065 domain-containing protein [Lachnospira sp.]|nr:DUF4065 domain-containing protein [Lachnospira sp.]